MSDIYVRFVSGKYFLGDEKQNEQVTVRISLEQEQFMSWSKAPSTSKPQINVAHSKSVLCTFWTDLFDEKV